MEIKFDRARIETDEAGVWLSLRAVSPRMAREFASVMKDAVYTVTPKKWRARRSLDANAYLWTLSDKIAQVVGNTKEDVYRDAIEHKGACDVLMIRRDALPDFIKHWSSNGIGWFCQKIGERGEFVELDAYYGSSTYNTQEMSLIIDWVVQLAKDLDIEAETPEEITLMKSRWDDAQAH